MRIEGPVEIAFVRVDPASMGEPHIFGEDDVTFVTVPTWGVVAEMRGLLRKYGHHLRDCHIHMPWDSGCDCGWAEAMDPLDDDDAPMVADE